jgi:hypothetical protein
VYADKHGLSEFVAFGPGGLEDGRVAGQQIKVTESDMQQAAEMLAQPDQAATLAPE